MSIHSIAGSGNKTPEEPSRTHLKNAADNAFELASKGMEAKKKEMDDLMAQLGEGKTLSEGEMIQLNTAASRYSTMVSLASGLVKNLTDTEKQVANKM